VSSSLPDSRPLSQREQELVQRIFSDPFSIPISWKTWLVSFLEVSDLNLPLSSINGLIQRLGVTAAPTGGLAILEGLPPGAIVRFAGTSAPEGTLLCDGSSHEISDHQALWEAISDAGYGQVDADHFNVPDLRGELPISVIVT